MVVKTKKITPSQQLADAQARIAQLELDLAQAREAQNLFHTVIDAIPVRVFWKDANLTYLGANQKFAQDAGLTSREQIIGKSDYDLGWKDQAELYRADDSAVIQRGTPKTNYEEPQTTPDGGRIWLETSKIPLRNAVGHIIGVLGTYDDITRHKSIQESLADREGKLRAIFEALPDLVFVVKRDGTFTEYHAPETSDLYVPHDQIIGRTIGDIMPPPLAAALIQHVAAALDTHKVQEFDYMLPLPKGNSYFQARFSAAGPDSVLIVIHNETERKLASQRIEELATIVETTTDFVASTTAGGNFTYINPAGRRMLGLPPSPAPITRTVFDITPPWALDLIGSTGIPAAIQNGTWTGETAFIGPDGSEVPVSQTLIARMSPDGTPAYIYSIARDISEQRRAMVERERFIAEALAQNERLDRALALQKATFDASADGILAVDNTGKVVSSNASFLRMWRIPAEVAASSDDQALLGFVIDQLKDPQAFSAKVTELYNTPEVSSHDFVEMADGRIFERFSEPQRVQDQPVGRVWNFRDITDLRQSQKDREQLIRQLRESLRFKDEFFAMMSHELRTPLNAMIGLLGISMMKGKLSEDDKMLVTRARANSERLLTLINNILDISRMEAGRLEIVPRPVSLRALCDKLQADMGVLAEQKQLEFNLNLGGNVPDIVLIDEDAINKILVNLVANAIKFTEQGIVRLDIEAHDGHLNIQVVDTGIGIPAHMRDVIFESFRQVDTSTTRRYGGSGLGLSIVRNLCLALHGTIRLDSKLGEGTAFYVMLPYGLPA